MKTNEPTIFIQPEDLWGWFKENKQRLVTEMAVVAKSDDLELCITEQSGYPNLMVIDMSDKGIVYEEDSYDIFSLQESYEDLIKVFLESYEDDEPNIKTGNESVVFRDDEIQKAYIEFLKVLLGPDKNYYANPKDPDVEKSMEDAIDAIATYGFPIYRPTMVNGVLDKYPYTIMND